MAKTYKPPFAQTNQAGSAILTTAMASTSGNTPTNTVLIGTVGADGALLIQAGAVPLATVTATDVSLFYRLPTDAANIRRLIKSVTMAALSVATTAARTTTDFGYTESAPYRLPANAEIYMGLAVTQTAVQGFASWVDF